MLDPAKVNLGLAYYGRGLTLADRTCTEMDLLFSGPSKPAPCTNFKGVMSNREIKQSIKDKNLTPKIIDETQVKQTTWGDQWIGYDDDDTYATKVQLANSLCMGGTMVWSIDFDSGSDSGDVLDNDFRANSTISSYGGGNDAGSSSGGNSGSGSSTAGAGSDLVYVDPTIWIDPEPLFACEPPYVLVLPPVQLPTPTVISFPPLITTYVISAEASISAGQQHGPTLETITTATDIPPLTTNEIQMWAITIFANDSTSATITPIQSVQPSPVTVSLSGPPLFFEITPTPGSQSSTVAVGALQSHLTAIYPHPTHSIDFPPRAPISYTSSTPKPSCTAHCGHHDCKVFGCGGDCDLFGCGGNCGLLGCGGGCGLAGCGGGCGIFGCGGCGLVGCGEACPQCAPNFPKPGTTGGDSGGEDENDPDENDDEDDEDEDEDDDETEECILEEADLADSPTEADGIVSIDEIHSSPDPTAENEPSVLLPTSISPSTGFITTITPTSTVFLPDVTITVTPIPTPIPTPQIRCQVTIEEGFWYKVLIWRMEGAWVSDGGGRLHDEESGCGKVTEWTWHDDKDDGDGTGVTFRLPLFIKDGCVGRAIGSAGGPTIDC